MCPASHSACSRTSRIWRPRCVGLPAVVELVEGQPRQALDGALLLAPGRHATGEVAGDLRDADGGGERHGVAGVVVVASDDARPAARGSASHASLEPKPGAQRGDAERRRGCAPRRTATRCARRSTSAPSRWWESTCRGASGCASMLSRSSGPRLSATMFSEVRWLRPQRRRRLRRRTACSSVIASSSWWARS